MPNLSRAVRPAAYDIATIGSGAGPLMRSDNQRLSKPTASISSTTAPNCGPWSAVRAPSPRPTRTFGDAVWSAGSVVVTTFDGSESHRALRLGILGR